MMIWKTILAVLLLAGGAALAQPSPAPTKPLSTGVWKRLGVVITPNTALEIGAGSQNAQEPTFIDQDTASSCTLLNSAFANKCSKVIYTCGTTPVLCYAETPDGINGVVKSPTAIASGYRSSSWTVNQATFTASSSGTTLTVTGTPTGQITNGMFLPSPYSAGTYISARGTGTGGAGTYTISASQTVASQSTTGTVYYLLAASAGWTQIDLLTAATSIGPYSVTKSSFIPLGAGGSWNAAGVTNTSMIFQNGTAYIFLEGYQNGVGSTGGIGLFTSTDMTNVSQPVSNPVASSAGGGGVVGTSFYGGPTVPFYAAGRWNMWIHTLAGTSGSELSMLTASSLTSPSWTIMPSVLTRMTAAEGIGTNGGQIADPTVSIRNNKVFMWATENFNGVSLPTGQFQIAGYAADLTMDQLVASVQGSDVSTLATNQAPRPSNVFTFTGAGTYNWTPPYGAKAFQVTVRGQGGCGGGGASLGATGSGSGGGGGGGGSTKRFDWIPVSVVTWPATIQIGAQCTAAAAGANGASGGQAFFGVVGLDSNAIAYAGGGGAGGASAAASGGGGGAGTIGNGTASTSGTGGAGGNLNGTSGGSGVGPGNNTSIMGSGGGGGSSALGVSSSNANAIDGATGGGSGGGCNAGTPAAGGLAVSSLNGITVAGGTAGGATGNPGGTGTQAGSHAGNGGSGGGGGTATGGAGGNGGIGGGGGGGGGAGCGVGAVGGPGGVGGAAQVVITVL